jgi:carboxyl-terminal processing protease
MIRTAGKFIFALLLTSTSATASDEETTNAQAQLSLDDLRTFTDVFNQVRNNFVDEVDDQTLLNAAIRGMLSELDPHSSYMEADDFRQQEENSKGHYSGIGVEVVIKDEQINIVSVMQGSAAENAGIVGGDVITAIGGTDLRRKNLKKAIDALRGEAGSSIEVTIRHDNGEVSNYELVRGIVKVASVFSRLIDGDYGYFKITQFTIKSADEFQEQVHSIQEKHKEPLKGVILDLRNNPGGVVKSAVTIADGFLEEGMIVYTSGRAPSQLEYKATPGQWLGNIPMVVLVDSHSASSSEVLAGALQDHERALIVGEKTFGKGSIQSVLNLRNGSGLHLTTSRYYTPTGRSIQAEGIQPDVEIPSVKVIENESKGGRESDLDRHLKNESKEDQQRPHSEVSPADDYMLYQALILLKGASVFAASLE